MGEVVAAVAADLASPKLMAKAESSSSLKFLSIPEKSKWQAPMKDKTAELDAAKVTLSMYALDRKDRGLPGLPANPKAPAKIGHKQIARETGLRDRLIRDLGPHLLALAATYGLEDPVAASVAADVARIRQVYKSKPLPEWKNGTPHLREIADETGLLIRRVEMPECRAVIAERAATNGVVPVVRDVDRELALIDAYARTLRERGLKLPWKAGQDLPDLTAIAQATSIPRERLRTVGALKAAMARLVAELRPDAEQTFEAEIARLTHHVDRMLAGEIPVPTNAHGIFVAEIARQVGIVVHRLKKMPEMRAQIVRLEAAGFGEGRDAVLARLRDHVERAIRERTPIPVGGKGVCYAEISRILGVSPQWLRTMKCMRVEIDRWAAACVGSTKTLAVPPSPSKSAPVSQSVPQKHPLEQ